MFFVYKITNVVNGKQYVGQSIHPEKRFIEHYRYSYGNSLVSRAIKKYGLDNFFLEIIEKCKTQTKVDYQEIYWVKTLRTLAPNGYNLEEGGRGGIPSLETRKKMGNAAKKRTGLGNPFYGKTHSEEVRRKISLSRMGKGRPHSEESKRKISRSQKNGTAPWLGCIGEKAPRFGAVLSDETKKKISEAHKGRTLSQETRQRISEGVKRAARERSSQ